MGRDRDEKEHDYGKPSGSKKKLAKVTATLKKHESSLKGLTEKYTLSQIAVVAQELVLQQIFASPAKARARFPKLYSKSSGKDAERAASEAATLQQNEQKVAVKAQTADDLAHDNQVATRNITDVDPKVSAETEPSLEQPPNLPIPRLHPVYLPFRTQHKLLVPVQSILEATCFAFGNAHVPDVMRAMEWYVPESLELSEWNKAFVKNVNRLPAGSFGAIPHKKSVDVIFDTQILRHAAVHRLPTSAAGMLKMLDAAIDYATALQDTSRATAIQNIRRKLSNSIEEIINHQHLLECRYLPRFEEIATKRAELDAREQEVIEGMLAEDKQQREEVGTTLEASLFDDGLVTVPSIDADDLSFESQSSQQEGEAADAASKSQFVSEQNEETQLQPTEKVDGGFLRRWFRRPVQEQAPQDQTQSDGQDFAAPTSVSGEQPMAEEHALSESEAEASPHSESTPGSSLQDGLETETEGQPLVHQSKSSESLFDSATPLVDKVDSSQQTSEDPTLLVEDGASGESDSQEAFEEMKVDAVASDGSQGHSIALRIQVGRKTYLPLVSSTTCTRHDILDQARDHLLKLATSDPHLEHLLGEDLGIESEEDEADEPQGMANPEQDEDRSPAEEDEDFENWVDAREVLCLTELQTKGEKMDLTSYPQENLRGLIETVEQSELPVLCVKLQLKGQGGAAD